MICAVLVALIALILPLCIRYITKDILEAGLADATRQIYMVGAGMVALVVIQAICGFFQDYRGHALGAMMETDLRRELFEHYQKLSFSFYDEQKTGQLMSRITNDLFSLAELYHHGPEDYLINSIRFIGAFAVLIYINAPLALLIFVLIPVMALFTLYMNKKLNVVYKSNYEKISEINAQVEDNLAGIRVVKSFTNEALEQDKFALHNHRFLRSRKAIYKLEAYFSNGVSIAIQLMTVAVIVFGSISITGAQLDLADLIVFLLYIGYLTQPIQSLSHLISQFQQGITGFERFMQIMDLHPDIEDATDALELEGVQGQITFDNVSFHYKAEQGYVLKNFSLKVNAGEYVALVGFSGVGKTTLCSLIPRFYEVSEGAILVDGVNIKDVSLSSLRRHIGIVQQDVYLFAGTIEENIAYGRPNASREEIVQAAKLANAHHFIMSLPDGYDTDIGQRGVKLSGGQKQRLSIARVFLKDPAIIIFDEATSSLDNESELVVQESLELLAKNRTTLVIAHRLSTIRNAQRIVVLTEDGLGEQGTHEQLIELDRAYAKLYKLQFKV